MKSDRNSTPAGSSGAGGVDANSPTGNWPDKILNPEIAWKNKQFVIRLIIDKNRAVNLVPLEILSWIQRLCLLKFMNVISVQYGLEGNDDRLIDIFTIYLSTCTETTKHLSIGK